MNKKFRVSKGFTLVELLLATLILGFTLAGLLQVFLRCNALTGVSQDKTAAMSLLQGRMEDIRERSYDDVVTLYDATASGDPAEVFDLDPLTGKGVVYITQFTAGEDNLLQIKIVGSWRNWRTYGEDLNLDGVEDTGEDVDGDGDLSSIATVISFIAARN